MTRGEVEILNIYLHGDSSQGAVSGIVDRELVSFSSFIQNLSSGQQDRRRVVKPSLHLIQNFLFTVPIYIAACSIFISVGS